MSWRPFDFLVTKISPAEQIVKNQNNKVRLMASDNTGGYKKLSRVASEDEIIGSTLNAMRINEILLSGFLPESAHIIKPIHCFPRVAWYLYSKLKK